VIVGVEKEFALSDCMLMGPSVSDWTWNRQMETQSRNFREDFPWLGNSC